MVYITSKYHKVSKLVESKRAYWRDYAGMDMLMLKIKDDISAELTDVLETRLCIGLGNPNFPNKFIF